MTLRQARLVANLGDPRIKTKKEAILKAGYSASMAEQQSEAMKYVGFKERLNEYLPIEEGFVATRESLKAVKSIPEPQVPMIDVIDYASRLKAAEQVYKLHNVLQPDQTHNGDNITVNIQTYGESDNFRTPGLASTFRDNEQQSQIQDPQLASESP